MSEAPAEQSAETLQSDLPAQGDPVEQPAKTPDEEIADLRAALKAANKDAEKNRLRLRENEKANETELETAQREATEAREALSTETAKAFRLAAVTFGGIEADDAELLMTGTDIETLAKQALRLVARAPTSAGPKPDLTQGGSGQPLALNSDGLEEALRSKLGI